MRLEDNSSTVLKNAPLLITAIACIAGIYEFIVHVGIEQKQFDLWNSGFNGLFLLVVPIALRFLVLKPRLKITYTPDDGDKVPLVFAQGQGGTTRIQVWYRLRVQNVGTLKLINPRVYCVAMTAGLGNLSQPITPFELNWSETDRNFQAGSIFPGRFRYRLDLFFADIGVVPQNAGGFSAINPGHLIVARRNQLETTLLLPNVPYNLCLIISNDNFLVPSHYCHVRISWKTGNAATLSDPLPQPIVDIQIIEQSPLWKKRTFLGGLKMFEA